MHAFLQVLLALILVAALFLLAFFIYNRDALQAAKTNRNPRVKTAIFKGIKDLNASGNEMYNTSDPQHPTYRAMPPAMNQGGGAEFTYNFWLQKLEGGNSGYQGLTTVHDYIDDDDLILLLRGSDKEMTTIKNVCGESVCPSANECKKNYLLKCPLIKLQGINHQYLVVEFNTVASPLAVKEGVDVNCTTQGEWISVNKYKIALDGLNDANFNSKWFMVTVVIADTDPSGILPVRNKVRVRIYVNGVLELEQYADSKRGGYDANLSPSVLLQNQGPLYVGKRKMPDTGESRFPENFYMADLTYMNYAASPDEIKALFNAGFDKSVAPSVTQSSLNEFKYKESAQNMSQARGEPQLFPI